MTAKKVATAPVSEANAPKAAAKGAKLDDASKKTVKPVAKAAEPAAKGKPGRKPKESLSQGVDGYLATPPQAANGEADLLAAMEAMKPLVAALGADKVKRIADLLS